MRASHAGSGTAEAELELGRALVRSWQSEGAFRLAADEVRPESQRAFAANERFFAWSATAKARYVSDLTYAGYAAPGEESGGGERTRREAFTICQDIAPDDPRVRELWPCHGPVPWPDAHYRRAMLALADRLGEVADRVLRLVALGLAVDDPDVFARLTWGGWHSLRALHFPPQHDRAGRLDAGSDDSGIDDGLVVILVRPGEGEPLTVLPGVLMHYLTGGLLLSAPRGLRPKSADKYGLEYFHVPNFQTCVRPLTEPSGDDFLHYGTHFTLTTMRRFPARATTRRILAEQRLSVLCGLREQAGRAASPV